MSVNPPRYLSRARIQAHDPLRGVFSGGDDHGGRVAGHHTGEDGSVDDEEVVCAVNLSVEVDDSRTSLEAAVNTELGSTL